MPTYFHNEHWLTAEGGVIPANHRAFCFGDGYFESIRAINGKAVFVDHHYQRMLDTAKAMHIHVPDSFTLQHFKDTLQTLLEHNNITEGGRIRATVSREPGGTYLPSSNAMDLFIQVVPFEHNLYTLNTEGKDIDLYPDLKKAVDKLSVFKTVNCNVYVMASLYAREKNWDDALIQNYRSGIIEASSSNLFLVSNGVLYTPGLEDGPVGGTMRMNIINLAIEHGIKVYECSLSPQNLLVADEIFLTNAIRGVQWVSSYRTKRYFNNTSKQMVALLNEKVAVAQQADQAAGM